MAQERNNFWNDAGKAGLVVAGVASAYFVITALLGKIENGGFAVKALSILLWAGKVALCIWLMIKYLKAFAGANDKDRTRTFRYGTAIAACSALVYAAFYLCYVSLIDPNMFSDSIDAAVNAYSGMLTSEQIDHFMNMESSMPTITFFVNLIWCWLFGTIVSAIASSNICGQSNPFEDED